MTPYTRSLVFSLYTSDCTSNCFYERFIKEIIEKIELSHVLEKFQLLLHGIIRFVCFEVLLFNFIIDKSYLSNSFTIKRGENKEETTHSQV